MPDADYRSLERTGPWHVRAGALIGAAAILRIAYLAWACPLDLAPDEAHYWDWSRHLDWSYYSKGPLVACLIRLGCTWAAPLTDSLNASAMLAVRLPAVLCGSLMLVALYVLTLQVYGQGRLAFMVVAIALTLPPVTAGASLMTIDAPYTCCWAWALVFGYLAVFRGASWAWAVTGLAVGLGILAKYTMVLWLPSLALFLMTTPALRQLFLRPGVWVLLGLALTSCLPILIWNMQHDWVTLRHVGGQAGIDSGPRQVLWLGPLTYVGTQGALFLGYWFVAWAAAMIAHRPWRETRPEVRYLWWMSAPTFGVFLIFSLKTKEQPNWPITAYLSGLVLTAAWLAEQLRSTSAWYRRLTVAGLATACGLGILGTIVVHRADWFQPMLVQLSGPPTEQRPLPLRRFDPTCRLRGWQTLAAEVDRVRAELQAQGIEPVLAGSSWTLPGELGFYCRGRPVVYSLGLVQGDRHSQYDLWHPNPIRESSAFLGRTFIFVGDLGPAVRAAFDQVEPTRSVTYRERGQPIACWSITVCRGFRGFAHLEGVLETRHY